MTQVVEATRRDAWHVLGIEHPHTPKLLSRAEKLVYAKQLREEAGWPLWAIGETFGVHESVVSRWLHGDPQRWREVAGRGPSSKPKLRARQPQPVAATAPPLREPNVEEEPDNPWDADADDWDDDEVAELSPVAPPRPAPRARAKPPQQFGVFTPAIEAALARRGLDRLGRPIAEQATTAPQEASTRLSIPPAPDVRQPWTPPVRHPAPTAATRAPQPVPGVPARAVDAEVVASCGHALYVPPAKAARGAALTCTRCGRAGQVQRLTGRYTLG